MTTAVAQWLQWPWLSPTTPSASAPSARLSGKTVKPIYKTVKPIYKTVKPIYKTVKPTYKTVKPVYDGPVREQGEEEDVGAVQNAVPPPFVCVCV